MNDLPRQKLRELILEYGCSLSDDPRRCEALLKDYCGTYKREIFVLVNALKNGIASDLIKMQSSEVPETIIWSRATQRLEDELAMSAEAAQWAVESWALALGVIVKPFKPLTVFKPVPKAEPIPLTQPTDTLTALLSGRYQDNGDGTVTDVKTGLQWMRCSLGQEWRDGTCVGNALRYLWDAACKAATTLNRQGGYAGYRDWCLPTREELLTLVYCSSGQPYTWNNTGKPCKGEYQKPTIDQSAFPNTPSSNVWSGSLNAYSSGYAWGVGFSHGLDGSVNQTAMAMFVSCAADSNFAF